MLSVQSSLRKWWWLLIPPLLIGIYLLLPISGQVVVSPGSNAQSSLWPRIVTDPAVPKAGEEVLVTVSDLRPWGHVSLMLNGLVIPTDSWEASSDGSVASWHWKATIPAESDDSTDVGIRFYSDCHLGCQLRGKLDLPGLESSADLNLPEERTQSKLCVAFANQERDWHNRSGWVIDTTYFKLADDLDDTYWSVDELAVRAYNAHSKGLQVLIRVDYDRGQTVPPINDFLALDEYLKYLQQLARDERLSNVYGYIIGRGMNALSSSSYTPDQPITPEWYARVFNGYGEPASHTDNVVQRVRSVNPNTHLIVGPVRPWIEDQSGPNAYAIDVPWLSYMDQLMKLMDESTASKAAAGFARVGPDGFALNASGRVTPPNVTEANAAEEPMMNLKLEEWGDAQAGFRVYEDFLEIINDYPSTRGLPAYINATNTFTPDERVPPGQNYPDGWLTNALAVVNKNPQVHALCWFLDLVPGDDRWDAFSLSRRKGQLIYADNEFDALLRISAE